MVTDSVAREYKFYGNEVQELAKDIKALTNDGYRIAVHYAAGNVGSALLIATKEQEAEKAPVKTARSTRKKETAAE